MSEEWYRLNAHDAGTCGLQFGTGECPNVKCENHWVSKWGDTATAERYLEDLPDPTGDWYQAMAIRDAYDRAKKEGKMKWKAIWLTVSPGPDVEFKVFFKRMQEKMNSKFITSAFWGYEWRYNGTNNEGVHLHCWIKGSSDWRRCRDFLKRCKTKWGYYTFMVTEKGVWPKQKNMKQYMNFGKDWEADKWDYISGRTHDDDKDEQKAKDKKMRIKLGIKQIYVKNYVTF